MEYIWSILVLDKNSKYSKAMKVTKQLTALEVECARPKVKSYKLYDGNGLILLVLPSGQKSWHYSYTKDRHRKSIKLGSYPAMTLSAARTKRLESELILKNENQILINRTPTIRSYSLDWNAKNQGKWSIDHEKRMLRVLELYVFPKYGDMALDELTPRILLDLIRKVEKLGRLETAHRIITALNKIYRSAVIEGYVHSNPALLIRGELRPVSRKHYAAVTEPKEVGGLLRIIWDYDGKNFLTKSALQLSAYLFQRPGEIRQMRWRDINFKKNEWRYLVGKTKTDHVVPLADQVVAILEELAIFTGGHEYVFISLNSEARPMSENTLTTAMRRCGISKEEMTPHGFRAMARTLLDEELNYRVDIIEQQMAHRVADPLGRTYNRTKFLKERREMMQHWADYLDSLRLQRV